MENAKTAMRKFRRIIEIAHHASLNSAHGDVSRAVKAFRETIGFVKITRVTKYLKEHEERIDERKGNWFMTFDALNDEGR